jgi:hypothetical protein
MPSPNAPVWSTAAIGDYNQPRRIVVIASFASISAFVVSSVPENPSLAHCRSFHPLCRTQLIALRQKGFADLLGALRAAPGRPVSAWALHKFERLPYFEAPYNGRGKAHIALPRGGQMLAKSQNLYGWVASVQGQPGRKLTAVHRNEHDFSRFSRWKMFDRNPPLEE